MPHHIRINIGAARHKPADMLVRPVFRGRPINLQIADHHRVVELFTAGKIQRRFARGAVGMMRALVGIDIGDIFRLRVEKDQIVTSVILGRAGGLRIKNPQRGRRGLFPHIIMEIIFAQNMVGFRRQVRKSNGPVRGEFVPELANHPVNTLPR